MYQRLRFSGLVLCMTVSLVCGGAGQATAAEQSAASTTRDPYVGLWVNLKDALGGLSIQPEGEAYIVENEEGQKYVATKTNGVLRISGPTCPMDALYVKSSDHLVAAGNEYKRFNPNGPEAQRVAQLRSMADMRNIATAWEARATDTNSYSVDGVSDGEVSYAQLSNALAPTYIRRMPRDDGWGTPFVLRVSAGGQGYSIRSLGANKRFDETPQGETTSPDADILFVDGSFVSYPEGAQ